jgi:hypothetical protein
MIGVDWRTLDGSFFVKALRSTTEPTIDRTPQTMTDALIALGLAEDDGVRGFCITPVGRLVLDAIDEVKDAADE